MLEPQKAKQPGDPLRLLVKKLEPHERAALLLALLLRRALEKRLAEKGESWEWAEILRGLDHLQEVEAVFQGRDVLRPMCP